MSRDRTLHRAEEQGVALVVVMVLLVVVTLLALASLRNAILEERMSAAVYDRSLAFQAVEAALREGEAVAAARPEPVAGSACVAGLISGNSRARTGALGHSSSEQGV